MLHPHFIYETRASISIYSKWKFQIFIVSWQRLLCFAAINRNTIILYILHASYIYAAENTPTHNICANIFVSKHTHTTCIIHHFLNNKICLALRVVKKVKKNSKGFLLCLPIFLFGCCSTKRYAVLHLSHIDREG